ncbi:Shedu immune nuclease family protein [Saccharothrix luteola]|uniref:Shedu immune nuclease family protein n=1 Tax=Saccharothrix luteola TaxID=2893018 RepID=UPI001E533F67|nr:Shedu immune nuclease family protein [Saccharothrix luteola]MCC8243810.1 DUF4263 domain-containing protein [Saccharothrix luteola]
MNLGDVRLYYFSVEDDDFSQLKVRLVKQDTGFSHFYDVKTGRTVKDFVLDDGKQVATLCRVTLIKKDGRYSPRIRLWKRDKTKVEPNVVAMEVIDDVVSTREVKAIVDTNECHGNFWRVINFLQSLSVVSLPDNHFRLVDDESGQLAQLLQGKDRRTVVEAVREALGAQLTEADIKLLANRKKKLEVFGMLLTDERFFEEKRVRFGKNGNKAGPEAVWQKFFEDNTWIFGYGLNVVSCQAVKDGKLEQITTGANLFGGAGKRIDALLRSRGFVSSLLFCEIKTHKTPLLAVEAYRPPDVFQPSDELSGGLAQLQKTVDKAVRDIGDEFHRLSSPDGTPTGVEVAALKPKQVLVIGSLKEFEAEHGISRERATSFELFRRGVLDTEVVTFDELFERARFIVQDV